MRVADDDTVHHRKSANLLMKGLGALLGVCECKQSLRLGNHGQRLIAVDKSMAGYLYSYVDGLETGKPLNGKQVFLCWYHWLVR